ncbi:MAG: ribonuclease HII [Patescibacteria group bacterium]|nr:ribonuclease HII [Patescibacteria group bacterium]
MKRIRKKPNLKIERDLQKEGYLAIAGVDEAGRGAWAGPVVAAAVVLPFLNRYYGINDSKLLTPLQREKLLEKIYEIAAGVGLGVADTSEIDEMGIGRATYLAMRRAVDNLEIKPQYILVDGFKVGFAEVPSSGVIDGDCKSVSIAAASIVAKVSRDRMMQVIAENESCYKFELHKGYGTALHQQLIDKHGVSNWHRKSYKPIKEKINNTANLAIKC